MDNRFPKNPALPQVRTWEVLQLVNQLPHIITKQNLSLHAGSLLLLYLLCTCAPFATSDSAEPWTAAHQASLTMGFLRQEYCSGLSFPPPGDLPDPGMELWFPASPAWQEDSLPLPPPGKPLYILWVLTNVYHHVPTMPASYRTASLP